MKPKSARGRQIAMIASGLVLVLGVAAVAVGLFPALLAPVDQVAALLPHTHTGNENVPHSHIGNLLATGQGSDTFPWNEAGVTMLKSLWIESLPPVPPSPSNAVADDPRAAQLGQRLFFDTRFSSNGQVSCATCHQSRQFFTDGQPLATGVGTTSRKTMTIVGAAYSPWQFWDGRKDSLWSQALGPMESPVEHGGNRTRYAHIIAQDSVYRVQYEAIYGPLPPLSDADRFPPDAGPVENETARAAWESMSPADQEAVSRVYANMGKAIAAYERLIVPAPSRFDFYVQAVVERDEVTMGYALTPDEVAGLQVFLGKGHCIECHNGPLFTNNSFHNTGIPGVADLGPDNGRLKGIQDALADEFNCLSPYSDASPNACAELRFAKTAAPELAGAFKPPSLRNAVQTPPYMHAGQIETLRQVLEHYNQAPAAPVGKTELVPLGLTDTEMAQLEAFIVTLSRPLQVNSSLLDPPMN